MRFKTGMALYNYHAGFEAQSVTPSRRAALSAAVLDYWLTLPESN
jgi:hypothetical protein